MSFLPNICLFDGAKSLFLAAESGSKISFASTEPDGTRTARSVSSDGSSVSLVADPSVCVKN